MWGWVLAAVLWVLGAPCFWNAVKDQDESWYLKVFALLVWPPLMAAAAVAYAWQRIIPPKPRPVRHDPVHMTTAQMRALLDQLPAGFGDKQPK